MCWLDALDLDLGLSFPCKQANKEQKRYKLLYAGTQISLNVTLLTLAFLLACTYYEMSRLIWLAG